MRKLALATTLAVLVAAPAFAQQGGTEGQSNGMQPMEGMEGNTGMASGSSGMMDLSILPQGCQDAIDQSAMSGMMQGMDMSGMMPDMDEAQQASMDAMMGMNGPMMATHTIKDPDLAFNCGMIAHHTGAISMAEVEIQYGDDEESKALAQEIIDAQRTEIEEMTAWVEENAGQ